MVFPAIESGHSTMTAPPTAGWDGRAPPVEKHRGWGGRRETDGRMKKDLRQTAAYTWISGKHQSHQRVELGVLEMLCFGLPLRQVC